MIFVLFLSFTSVNICALFEYQLKTYLTLYIGDVLLKQQDYLMFFQIDSNVLFLSKSINNSDSAPRKLTVSKS